ncbi:hypothetical protein PVAND_013944 [Polypedilum vanderplanki]|uniref:Uncharacterized protein n=1 Tax=Polypedilum vanderplanki TaxID=319348 RepID=A0A9J6CQW6_POLVA|nr:hypothetical protein PVAND_013944 [Polypedilum vanderplanki]
MTTNQISNRWTPIKTTKKSFYTCQGGSVQVAREQFPLVMAEAITIHKSQGRSESKKVIDVRNPSKIKNHMDRQKWYVALSRARSLNGLYILGAFKPPNEIKPDDDVNAEMNRLRQNPLVPKYQFLRVVPENVIQIVSHNTESIRKHITRIVSDQVFSSSHIVTLQESWAIDNESYNIPDFEEISRNRLMGRPRAFGTINFCKLNIEARIVDRIEIEKGNSNNHVEISGFKLDNRLTIINVYNNPSSSLELLKETLLEVKDYIDESENILILGDFNHELKLGNQLESFMLGTFGTSLFSRRESTTNTRTVIDGVFGRIDDYNVEVFIYESYASHHKPLVIRAHEL